MLTAAPWQRRRVAEFRGTRYNGGPSGARGARRSGAKEVTMIATGTKAPGFKLADHLGREVELAQFAGKRHVMLLFYPLDFTPT
jgi:hypothetical protein